MVTRIVFIYLTTTQQPWLCMTYVTVYVSAFNVTVCLTAWLCAYRERQVRLYQRHSPQGAVK